MRKRGIGELPQLFNVLKGDVSIVGPRPRAHPPINEADMAVVHSPEILNVRPGFASSRKSVEISEGKELSLSEQVEMDINDVAAPYSMRRDFKLIVGGLPILLGKNPQYRAKADCDDPSIDID